MKSSHHNAAAQQEFATLEQVLIQTADEASACLRVLKTNLSDLDSRHGHHFRHTSKSFMRHDIRIAKDTAMDLKHVAHKIQRSHKPSKSEVHSARTTMHATTTALERLEATARKYDEKHGPSTGVKGAIKHAVHSKHHEEKKAQKHNGLLGKHDHYHQAGSGFVGSPDTAEAVVKMTIRDHLNLNVLSYHIASAEKSLSPTSIAARAKVAAHEVKDKLTPGNKLSPTRGDHYGNGGNHYGSRPIAP